MSKNNKKSNKQAKEINPLVAFGIIGVVLACGVFFVLSDDSEDYSNTASSSEHATTTIIEKVQAPDAVNAPMILPAQVKNLEVFNNEMSQKQHEAASAKLDASIAQSKLVVMQLQRKQIDVKRESMDSCIGIDEFGMSSSQPRGTIINREAPKPSYFNDDNVNKSTTTAPRYSKSIDVVMTMKVNGIRNALVKVNGESQRVSIGTSIDGTKYRVTNITDNKVCYRETGKNKATKCESV